MRSNITPIQPTSLLLVAFLTVTAPLSAALPAVAADYPSRPLRLLVPFPPGGGVDLLARLLGTRLGEALGQQVVVDNRAGGGGVIATDIAAKAPADGYTMLLGFIGPLAISPTISKLPYDPVGDFAALDPLASSYHIVVINPSLPARSVKEFIALAKSQPGKLNYASSGSGTNLHLAGELFKMVVGVNIVHVPYKGAGPAANAVLAGESHLLFGSITSSMPLVRANRLVALAVTSPARSPLAPEIPTLIESGVTGVNVPSWYILVVPARTPREVADRLRLELRKIAANADFREQLARQAFETRNLAPNEFSGFLKAELDKWSKVVRAVGIKPE